ncbi:carboxylesterase family protein [Streptomyces phaeochromogenes]|uniref:carboxylesterase family protein n=1 Tax=Streptomyces phaeochromogenes TaxID=1923 RepID=UPI00247FA758|nr:carboxylesterase family protein [Streptomyces phaeochromogenes]
MGPGVGGEPAEFQAGLAYEGGRRRPHASELGYLWPMETSKSLTPEQQQLSTAMVRYWGAFVKHANPTTAGPAAWPSYRSGKYMSLLPGDDSRALKSKVYADRHQCSFWNSTSYDGLTTDPDRLAADEACRSRSRGRHGKRRCGHGRFSKHPKATGGRAQEDMGAACEVAQRQDQTVGSSRPSGIFQLRPATVPSSLETASSSPRSGA